MKTSPADLVNPYIGTLPHLLQTTRPEVMLPHCYPKIYPYFDANSDYYCNEIVKGFPIGGVKILPGTAGAESMDSTEAAKAFFNTIDHSREDCRPYYNRIELEDNDIVVEYTVSEHAYAYRFSGGAKRLAVLYTESSEVNLGADGVLRIHMVNDGAGRFARRSLANEYLRITSNVPFKEVSKGKTCAVYEFEGDAFELFGAVSYISVDKADEIYAKEIKGRSFDDIKTHAFDVWDAFLSRFKVSGNDKNTQIAFYTAVYRSFQRMVNYGEYGKFYSGYDKQVHDGDFFYSNDNTWDTFRSMHPLQLLVEPERQVDLLKSYIMMYEQTGLMPSVPGVNGDMPVMIGFHAAALFADAAAKGLDLDYEKAYEGIRKNAMEQSILPWVCNQGLTELDKCYLEKGFFPALKNGQEEYVPEVHKSERRQSVAVTLEHCYDDWCAAQLAKKLGKTDDYTMFMKRADFYKKSYNKEVGFMMPRDIDGNWVECDPMWGGGQGGRDYYTENNAYTYNWSVFHDMPGLVELMGGDKATEKKLDELFTTGVRRGNGPPMSKFPYMAQFPDATGLMGQFSMGNEPDFHIPYTYNYCGAPWKTQKRIRDCMDIWFTNSPTGICGDEDGGAMSSFYVFSAMGFYPYCPGKDEYMIGAPLFDSVELTLSDGKVFKITADGAGDGARYIQSATLNGKDHNSAILKHADVAAGGELKLVMGRRPNKTWGVK
ncbi:MAG: GH92 family glycosyl hydrolase [Oscillospiraceae bacterium]|nr:GH92 family glycosyl hydrolase [Oscillospiraceae bacterium]